jgi:hypothetical protein
MAEATRIRGLFEASRLFSRPPIRLTSPSPCTAHLTLFDRNAPDGQALLKAGTIHLSQSVDFYSLFLISAD